MTKARRWPLVLIAAPAAVAVWSGWVGLGGLCGFGVIHPLPGIVPGFRLNTAITLPVGVEAYGAYALGAWLAPAGVPERAQRFAKRSAIGALVLGMLGQVVFHLLSAAHATRAPWPVVVLVSCMPVVTLGFGAALTHLLRAPGSAPEGALLAAPLAHMETAPPNAPEGGPAPVLESVPESAPGPLPKARSDRLRKASRSRSRTAPVTGQDAEQEFVAEIASGAVPSLRQIRSRMHVGEQRAKALREHLEGVATSATASG